MGSQKIRSEVSRKTETRSVEVSQFSRVRTQKQVP